jgi:electron transport complex protein RnfE
MRKYFRLFTNGLIKENPLLALMIGLCSALAVTTSVVNGIGMGVAMTFVLVMSEVLISLLRKMIPDSIRIPIFIIVIATFTTIVDLLMKAYTPDLSRSMGVFIPLIVVNCIIMGRVEAFSSKSTVGASLVDSFGMGLGYTWVLVGISFVRELLGAGTVLGFRLIPESFTIGFFAKSPGGFFVFALFIALNIAVSNFLDKQGSTLAKPEGIEPAKLQGIEPAKLQGDAK